jgi:hypothetical protein
MSDKHTENLPDCCSFEMDAERHREIIDSAKEDERRRAEMLDRCEYELWSGDFTGEVGVYEVLIESVPDELVEDFQGYKPKYGHVDYETACASAACWVAQWAYDTETQAAITLDDIDDDGEGPFAFVTLTREMDSLIDMDKFAKNPRKWMAKRYEK